MTTVRRGLVVAPGGAAVDEGGRKGRVVKRRRKESFMANAEVAIIWHCFITCYR